MLKVTQNQETAVSIVGLTHYFKKHCAVKNVSFDIQPGSIHGFVGPNGAGKTTTLRVLATLLKPSSGQVNIFGMNARVMVNPIRRRIGFMPDHFSMYRQMTVFEYLDFFGAAYGMSQAERDRTITDVLTLTDMLGRRDDLIRGLSRGMQQRVSLARVLVHDPDLLLLDEPASGLDPRARIELMEILRELRNMGKTIFISSHILSELADLCDSCTILDRGTVKYTGSMHDLLHGEIQGRRYHLEISEAVPSLQASLAALPGMEAPEISEDGLHYYLRFDQAQSPINVILETAIQHGAQIESMKLDAKHLNQAFLDLTEAGVRT